MNAKQCKHMMPNGKQCGGWAIKGSVFCLWHDPEKASLRSAAGKKGGSRSKIASVTVLPDDTPDIEIKSAEDVENLIGTTISQVRRGDIAPNVSNAVTQLLNAWIKIREAGSIEERLKKLEKALESDSGPKVYGKTG